VQQSPGACLPLVVDRQVTTCLLCRAVGNVSGGHDEVADLGAEMFRALADPTRRRILDELVDRDGQTLFEICARLATKYRLASTRQAISQHLAVLEGAGLVMTRREGRYKFHYLDTSPLDQIARRWPRHGQTGAEDR